MGVNNDHSPLPCCLEQATPPAVEIGYHNVNGYTVLLEESRGTINRYNPVAHLAEHADNVLETSPAASYANPAPQPAA